ncbi:TerC family protein [Marnyiella aurantia]|uniref:TerC family protein n=1 Tax=Marnyiella aurantia TaxID=2758037 RepID=A0A7D7RKZ6_9FLAO|nr:TerC family protein [Marnyiella aurantia]MBA5245785.1 TerC family protein [Marnyiella aurantia]MBP0611484.1 TerC family protein [Marnyiella aurantia]QMS98812.1 TerC family protein [Marnyiella aurantia]
MELFSLLELPNFADPQIWVSLLTLTFLEIVLGVDNIIFISIIADKLPKEKQRFARNLGLAFAMIFRIILLLMISWIIGLKEPVLNLGWFNEPGTDLPLALSWKDIILLAGGIFLIGKSTMEIHAKMRGHDDVPKPKSSASSLMTLIILQIILIDMVFSLDSILTAIGLVDNVMLMIIAVVISIGIMMAFAGPISALINKYPSLQMLALSFLVVIGVMLVAEGIHQHVSKNIIYSCLAFSLIVEVLNIRFRDNQKEKYLKLNPDLNKDLSIRENEE